MIYDTLVTQPWALVSRVVFSMQKAQPVNLSWTIPFAGEFGMPTSVLRTSASQDAARLRYDGSVVYRWCQDVYHNSGGSCRALIGRRSVLHQA